MMEASEAPVEMAPEVAAPDEASSANASPIPPAPVASPNARIAQPRKVVSASFVR